MGHQWRDKGKEKEEGDLREGVEREKWVCWVLQR